MNQKNNFLNELNSISDSLTFIQPVDNDNDINKAYVDTYTTGQQKARDRKITELLSTYVEAYNYKSKSNKWYKGILLFLCVSILLAFCISFIIFIFNADFNGKTGSVADVIQLISVCITFLGLIVGLLHTITKYVFPENEEEYITRIVELIQNNDLENKKENIKVQGKTSISEDKIEKTAQSCQ
uniref:Uncharacterized protein n=1 Tax=uncultured Spirochaetaceae bacterium TaxID=201186 RepID=A0A650ENL3_9SPIO|nr:hypothetical protein Unknown280_1490 [uncultured Spirochaetaceae bacterium]